MNLHFVELPMFTKQVLEIADDHFFRRLQNELLQNPEKGDLVPRLHGLRKVRMALPGRGRSGGARIIYLYLKTHSAVIFFYAYTKAKSENLSPGQERRLRIAVDLIKQEYRHEKEAD